MQGNHDNLVALRDDIFRRKNQIQNEPNHYFSIAFQQGRDAPNEMECTDTFDLLQKEMSSGKWDVIVADEIVGATSSGLLPISKVIRLIKERPAGLDLVLTGHHAPKKLIDLADLVTEMKPIKHPYEKGILAKQGIDF